MSESGKMWLPCLVADGVLSDEYAVIVRTLSGDTRSFWVPRTEVDRERGLVRVHVRLGDHGAVVSLPTPSGNDTMAVHPADLRQEPLLAVLPGHALPLSDWPTFGEKLPPLARGYLLTWNGDTVDVWGWGTSARRTRYNDLVHVESDSGARQCWCSITDRWLLIPGGAP